MRNLSFVTSIAFLSSAVAGDPALWLSGDNSEALDKEALILEPVKEWAVERLNSAADQPDYEYSIRKVQGGYEIMVRTLFGGPTEGYQEAVDGEMCLFVNRGFKLESARQCVAPL